MIITTGTEATTIILEDGQQVYPCRCGETHKGDYGFDDYMHHNCFHDEPLVCLGISYWICPVCGRTWTTQEEGRP